MLKRSYKKIIVYSLMLALCGSCLSGCNKDDAAADANAESPASNEDQALADAVDQALAQDQPSDNNQENNAQPAGNAGNNQPEVPTQTPIAEKSPVAITRIEPENITPTATAAGDASGTPFEEIPEELLEGEEEKEREPSPDLFIVEPCQVEITGIYLVSLAKDLLKEINSRRNEYGIGPVRETTSLLACADGRCKEQTYFVGHFRPDGRPFTSISPEGYVKGECIAIDYRTVKDIMEAWFTVNKSRMEIMNPDYTECGISIYDIDGTYFIAAEFAY